MRARRGIAVAALSCVLLAGAAFVVRRTVMLRPVRLLVDVETTRVLTPLLPDGTVNFRAHYAPKRDSLPTWRAAAGLVPRSPTSLKKRGTRFAKICADSANSGPRDPWLRASEAGLAKLAQMPAGGWPDPSTPDVRARVFAIAGESKQQQAPSLMSLVRSVFALACRCGAEALESPERALETVRELNGLALIAERAADEALLMVATQSMSEAVACAEIIAAGPSSSLLAALELPQSTHIGGFRRWFVEQRRMRVLDAAVDAFYKQPGHDIDINLMLKHLNQRFDAIENGTKVESAVESLASAVQDLRFASWAPFVPAAEVRRARTRVRAAAVAVLTEPSLEFADKKLRLQQTRLAELARSEGAGTSR